MYPTLITFGPLSLHSYGLFVALGFLAGIGLFRAEARRLGEDPERVTELCLLLLLAALAGARVFYILSAPAIFMAQPLEIFKIWNGGLVFYGGFVGALAAALLFFRRHRLPAWRWADMGTPGLALGHCFGRLGCFLAGCCYGRACDLPWGVTFSDPRSLAPTGRALHPTQLYEAGAMLLLFALLWRLRRRKRFEGQLFWGYVLIYGLARAAIETLRGDFRGTWAAAYGLSPSQGIGLAMALLSAGMLAFLGRRTCREDDGTGR
jgi:phosphatidylglycerol:prolipoprotein diacylglycerol transferase